MADPIKFAEKINALGKELMEVMHSMSDQGNDRYMEYADAIAEALDEDGVSLVADLDLSLKLMGISWQEVEGGDVDEAT